jgi:hypothetical protein
MPSQDLPPQARPGLRAAWTMVIIMSVLLAVALLAVVWGFMRQARVLLEERHSQAPPADVAASLTLIPGAHIVSAQTEAGRLVLRVVTPAGEEVEVIDLATGKLIQQIKTPK